MKAVLPLALVGALVAGTAHAAGGSSSMDNGGTQGGGQMGSSSSSHGQWNTGQLKQIQGALKQQGYDVGQVDGRLGPNTQQALRQFQEDKGIQATGQPDQQTLAALNMGGQNGNQQQGQMPGNHRNSSSRSGGSGGPSGSAGMGSSPTDSGGASGDNGYNSNGSSGTAGTNGDGTQ